MHPRRLIVSALLAAASVSLLAAASYTQVAEITVGGAASFDYLLADGPSKRLYVSHSTEVVVIDTEKNVVAGKITDTPGVHGIAIAPEFGRGFTTNGKENKVSFFDLKTLQTISKVDTGVNPDAIMYEPTQKQVWAFNHTGKSVTVIDAKTGAVVANTPLSGVVEAGQADASIGKVFINIEDTSAVDVVDMKTFKVVANYKVAPAEEPTGMAVDAANHHLFVGGGPNLVMMDTRTGKVIASAPICSGTDATFYEASTKTAFVSCRDGHVTMVAVSGETLKVTGTFATTPNARTMALDTTTHRIYVAGAKYLPVDPKTPNARPQAVPDSFRVLAFAPGK